MKDEPTRLPDADTTEAKEEDAPDFILHPSSVVLALQAALRLLGVSARSRAEIERKLARAGFPPEVIGAVIAECERRGWVEDAQFARAWIADRADRKEYGRIRLATELRNRGVDPESIAAATGSMDDADELRRAVSAARRRLHGSALSGADGGPSPREARRLSDFLQRRGFAQRIITQVFRELAQNTG
jgi:regulatory protein